MTYRPSDWWSGVVPPKGWDVADAVSDGWNADQITEFLRATVRPWPFVDAPPPADPTPPPPADPAPPPPERSPARSYDDLRSYIGNMKADDIDALEAVLPEVHAFTGARRENLLKALKSCTGTSLSTLREMLSEAEGQGGGGADHLDLARRTIETVGAENIICAGPFVWMWSDAGVWRQRDDRMLKQGVQRTIAAEGLPVNATLVNGVTDVLKTEIYKPDHRFNLGETETVNCLNGELVPCDDGWKLVPHCREHYRTTQIPVEYDPDATAPLFELFLRQVFKGDEDADEKARALLELFGYTLMSHARHELFVILIGAGGNGKSVLLNILEHLCGAENVAGVQPSNFDRSFQRAHLDQKLANIITELKQGEIIADAELKGITSGERSTVEHKFQDPFDMHPFATCWFGTNHMPHTRDFSEALFRRALILKFNNVFEGAAKDPDLKVKLLAELPGILNLSLAAYRRAVTEGFTRPASSEQAKLEWRLEADQVAEFVDECCEHDRAGKVMASTLFEEYQAWAGRNGISKTMSLKGMRDRLTRLGFGHTRDGRGRYVTGIALRVSGSGGDGGYW